MDESVIAEERKRKISEFLRRRYEWIVYILLALIVYISVKIRTLNLYGLKDVTTGTWTLGPDLDPFLFLRWSKYIVEHGRLFVTDIMRSSPLGLGTNEEYLLHPYLMAWFHKVAAIFGSESVTYSAIIYPVFMFALTLIAFFLFSREALVKFIGTKRANLAALTASLFLAIMPIFIPRTIAGIPEKESVAFLFMFLSFYFFLKSWNADKSMKRYSFAAIAGLTTAAMANVWGGYLFIFLTIPSSFLIAFLIGKVEKKEISIYAIWLAVSFIIMNLASDRFTYLSLAKSLYTATAIFVLITCCFYLIMYRTNKARDYLSNNKILSRFSPQIVSFVTSSIVVLLLAVILFGPSYISAQVNNITDNLIKPANTRLIQTVAENKQPFFTEWSSSFGPRLGNVDLLIWLAIISSAIMVFSLFNNLNKKEKGALTFGYVFLILAILLSRYSGNGNLNGESIISKSFYFGGFILFIAIAGYVYTKQYKKDNLAILKEINLGAIFLLVFLFFSLIAARSAIRLVMVLAPPLAVMTGYLVASRDYGLKDKKSIKFVLSIILLILVIYSAFSLYERAKSDARNSVPSEYHQQWQLAMSWVRGNTLENAVFAHWWDYGYWIQSIGERATVLDGGNNIAYWNHMMGRYVLTGEEEKETLGFLYAHRVSHLLIDSTDIGKYSAYSFIGSDATLDRSSYIPTFLKNNEATQQTKNNTRFVYQGGFWLDEDLIYEINGTRIFLPAQKAAIGAIIVEFDSTNKIAKQPEAIAVYGENQYLLPMRYGFDGSFRDFGSGIESGFIIVPYGTQSSAGNANLDMYGALLYLSPRTVKTNLAKYYLYGEESESIKLAHKEDDFVISQLKSQNPSFDKDFIYFYGLKGPIKIWEIDYPEDIEIDEKYLETDYPEELRRA